MASDFLKNKVLEIFTRLESLEQRFSMLDGAPLISPKNQENIENLEAQSNEEVISKLEMMGKKISSLEDELITKIAFFERQLTDLKLQSHGAQLPGEQVVPESSIESDDLEARLEEFSSKLRNSVLMIDTKATAKINDLESELTEFQQRVKELEAKFQSPNI